MRYVCGSVVRVCVSECGGVCEDVEVSVDVCGGVYM